LLAKKLEKKKNKQTNNREPMFGCIEVVVEIDYERVIVQVGLRGIICNIFPFWECQREMSCKKKITSRM
jgi:hypothetical protein